MNKDYQDPDNFRAPYIAMGIVSSLYMHASDWIHRFR